MDSKSQKRLFTPGPLNTSESVKQAMLIDMGSRDETFVELIAEIRNEILKVAGVSVEAGYEAIPMQGSGTFGIESVLSTVVAPEDRLLILVNGAYGRRIVEIAECLGINQDAIECPENEVHSHETVARLLRKNSYSHLVVVHCETTTGIMNPIDQWGELARQTNCGLMVDAMSSFGGVELELLGSNIDFLISSSNKCLQGVPGFALVIARRTALMKVQHRARSISLDLRAQWEVLQKTGQFRFTPPTHAMLAFRQALRELEQEGGVSVRASRYRENQTALVTGMSQLGFQTYVRPGLQSHVITAFLYLDHANFKFAEFYRRLSDRGMLIYPGKLAAIDCFRIGNIGDLRVSDMVDLLTTIRASLNEMQIAV